MKAILRSINNFSCKLKQSNNLKYNISPKIRSNKFKNISGNSNVTIEDAIKKDLKDYRVYGNTKQQILPDGYTQVDYIESSGTQYIDTGFIPNFNTEVELEFLHQQPNSSGFIYGSRIANNNNCHAFILFSGAKDYYPQFSNNASVVHLSNTYPELALVNTKYKVKNGKNGFYVNNIQIKNYDGQTSLNSIYPLYIFGLNEAGNLETRTAKARIYYFKIYDNDILVRDFIPCYRNSDNEVGLYDIVNNVFYTNQGTGVFTYGSIAPTPDAPIEMVSCGDRTKNLFDFNNVIPAYYDSVRQEIKDAMNINYTNKNITFTSFNKDSYFPTVYAGNNKIGNVNISVKPNTDYAILYDYDRSGIEKVLVYALNETTQKYVGLTTSKITGGKTFNTGNYSQICIRFGTQNDNGNTCVISNIHLKEGITASDYEPYGYKIPINVRSENLFDKDNANILNGYLIGTATSGNLVLTSSGSNRVFYIKCKPNRTYTIQKEIIDENKFRVGTTENIPSVSQSVMNYQNNDNMNFITFTTNSNSNYLIVHFYNTASNVTLQDALNTIQIIEGSTAPSKYIPYYNQTTNIYLDEPLRKIDGYSDYIDFANGKVVRNIGEVILDGSENWAKSSVTSVDRFIETVTRPNLRSFTAFSNYFINRNGTNIGTFFMDNGSNPILRGRVVINFSVYGATTLNDFKEWLSQNNVTVDYVLETPTIEDIGLPSIKLIEGKNIITVGTEVQGVFEAEYYSKEIIDISNYKYNLRKVED